MNEIYNKISNHIMLDNSDLKTIVNKRLKALNLYKNPDNVVFSDLKHAYMQCDFYKNEVRIQNKYKQMAIRDIVEDELVTVKSVDTSTKNIFLKDAYNVEILTSLLHELRHIEQFNILLNDKKIYNYLIGLSLKYMSLDEKFYYKHHANFISEYDAEMSAFLFILNEIENNNILIKESVIYYLNANIAWQILKSRSYDFDKEKVSKINSPLHLLELLTIKNECIKKYNKERLNNTLTLIKTIKLNNKTEYDRLITGDNLSEETIDEIHLIATGKKKVKNIFNYFENISYKNEDNDYVKKLTNPLLTKDKRNY